MTASDRNGRDLYDLVTRAANAVRRVPDSISVSASWGDGRDWEASLIADSQELTVSYGPAFATVETLEEATQLLKGIFVDEIVCVTALEKDTPVHHALARRDDPTASFTQLDRPVSRDMPLIDHVQIRSWTGKGDRD